MMSKICLSKLYYSNISEKKNAIVTTLTLDVACWIYFQITRMFLHALAKADGFGTVQNTGKIAVCILNYCIPYTYHAKMGRVSHHSCSFTHSYNSEMCSDVIKELCRTTLNSVR